MIVTMISQYRVRKSQKPHHKRFVYIEITPKYPPEKGSIVYICIIVNEKEKRKKEKRKKPNEFLSQFPLANKKK